MKKTNNSTSVPIVSGTLLRKVLYTAAILAVLFSSVVLVFTTGSFDWYIQEKIADSDENAEWSATVDPRMSSYFSNDYSQAKKRFISAGQSAGAFMDQFLVEGEGPGGEKLTVDVALLGSLSPKRVLLHTSGLHGIEGFAGSAIQLRILEKKPTPPEGCAIVLVHILNPYGMAWLRRFNESNVDLNRNFRFRDEDWNIPSEMYAKLNSLLNPRQKQFADSFLVQSYLAIKQHGKPTLKQTIAGGQNEYPRGLFYFGKSLEPSALLYGEWLQAWFKNIERLFVLDVHTGLGSRGEETLVHKIAATDSGYLSDQFGKPMQHDFVKEQNNFYTFLGGHNHLFPAVRIDFITQEFGTYANLYVLHALRDENRYHHYSKGEINHQSKLRLKEAFCPDDAFWRASVVEKGAMLFDSTAHLLFHRL